MKIPRVIRWLLVALVMMALGLALLVSVTSAQDEAESTEEAPAAELVEEAAESTETAVSEGGLLIGLRHLHSLVRWVAVALALAAVVKLGLGLAQNAPYDLLAQRLMRALSAVFGIQWLLGLIFFIAMGLFPRWQWEHLVVMTVAVALLGMHNRWKNAEDRIRYRNSLLLVLAALVLVFVGVALLPQGWRIFPA